MSERTLADHGVEHDCTVQLIDRVDRERAEAIERSMPIMSVAAAAGLHIHFLEDLYELPPPALCFCNNLNMYELGFDNDASIPLL